MCLRESTDVLFTTSRMFILLLSCFLLAGAKAEDTFKGLPEDYVVKYEICSTEACNATAKEILSGMDQNTEPCMDFYNFACKNWRNSNPDIIGLPVRTQFTNAELNIKLQFKSVLESTGKTNESEGLQLAKQLYGACMNTGTRQEQLSYLRNIVRAAGNWLLADPQAVPAESADQMDLYLNKEFGISWLHSIGYTSFMAENDSYVPMVKAPKIVRPPFADGSEKGKKKYAKFVAKVVRMFIGKQKYEALPKEQLRKEIDELLEFENATASVFDSGYKYCDMIKKNLSELQFVFPGGGSHRVDWETRLKPFMLPNKNEELVVACIDQIFFIPDLTFHHSERTIMNYIIWNFLMHVLPMIDTDVRNTIYPEKADKPRWQQCVEENEAISAVYYHILEKDAEDKNDKQALDIYDVMEGGTAWRLLGLKDRLRGTSVRLHAYKLHEKMATHFKNSEPYFSPMEYKKHFPYVNASQLYAENILTKAKFHYTQIADILAKPIAAHTSPEYEVTPFTVHVHGRAFNKARYVPAAALEMPFYHKDRPQSLNYGALGSIFGRSFMAEYYEYLLSSYLEDPRIVSFPLESVEAFRDNAQYTIQRWDEYPLKRKLSKDVVDLNSLHQLYMHNAQSDALRVAFEAYERESKLRKWGDVRLPGLEKYDDKQLFFLSYANAHCAAPSRLGLTKNEEIARAVVAEMDMEPRRKVILSLLQSEEFAETFNCKAGTWMNPSAKRFW